MAKLETAYYVVNTADNGSDAFAVEFDSLESSLQYIALSSIIIP